MFFLPINIFDPSRLINLITYDLINEIETLCLKLNNKHVFKKKLLVLTKKIIETKIFFLKFNNNGSTLRFYVNDCISGF